MRTETTFDIYYDRFRQNVHVRKTWTLHFVNGSNKVGIPWTSSIVNFEKPSFTFWDKKAGRVYLVRFKEIKSAEELAQDPEPVTSGS